MGIITSYSPACVSLEGGVNTHFHFFVVRFLDGWKSSGGGSEWMTSSPLKIWLTSSQMSGGFTSNLSVVTFSCPLVSWKFDVNYLHGSRSWFLQGLVRGFQKGCHSWFYTRGFGLYSWVPRGGDFTQYFSPSVWELHWLSQHRVNVPAVAGVGIATA